MSQTGDQSAARYPVFKSPSKLGTRLSTHCRRDERLSRPCPARRRSPQNVLAVDRDRNVHPGAGTCQRCFTKFRSGDFALKDAHRSGRA
ncbi:hypothetical protein TNCV_309111 [Trichonephila clavipes]|nr:hypothetical protein TNCV_309111 [Trichonephila clavipes]